MDDAPRRQHPMLNPEEVVAALRRLVFAWDGDDREEFLDALRVARRLLGIAPPERTS